MCPPDETAIPIPPPAGSTEGLKQDPAFKNPWTNGAEVEAGAWLYIAGTRIVALDSLPAGAAVSIYGATDIEGVLSRGNDAGAAAKYVATKWLVTDRIKENTLLAKALISTVHEWSDVRLDIDDGPILGITDEELGKQTASENHWQCLLKGDMIVPPWNDLPLRPTLARFDVDDGKRTLTFIEPGDDGHDNQEFLVTATLNDKGDIASASLEIALPIGVTLTFDEVADGAWEQPQTLWLRDGSNWMRIHRPLPVDALPYRLSSESRMADIGSWFGGALPDMGARLMLDRSGTKTLTIVRTAEGDRHITLSIKKPAFVLLLPDLAVDGKVLQDPLLPPGESWRKHAKTLQVVPSFLCGDTLSFWKLAKSGNANPTFTAPADLGANSPASVLLFARSENWVLPPEAAVNAVAGISALRVLLPLLPKGSTIGCELTKEGVVVRTDFESLADEAMRFGPLARYSLAQETAGWADKLGEELWPSVPSLPPLNQPEPAVLRAQYRTLLPDLMADGEPASYASTRVGRPGTNLAADAHPLRLPEKEGAMFVRRGTAGAAPKLDVRSEVRYRWPQEQFGWEPGNLFLSHRAIFGESLETKNAVFDWAELEIVKDKPPVADGPWFLPHIWIRLTDGSLIKKSLDPIAGKVAALKSVADNAPAIIVSKASTVNLLESFSKTESNYGGLHWFELIETIAAEASTFQLTFCGKTIEPTLYGSTTVASASRLVSAWAGTIPLADPIKIGTGIMIGELTRVYLELEREAGGATVMRAMLGYTADRVYGLAATELQVTEIFERKNGKLIRTLEFNGRMTLDKPLTYPIDRHCTLDIYCWDTRLAAGEKILRVICNYGFFANGSDTPTQQVSAIQDAVIVNGLLDLSADIVVLRTNEGVDDKFAHNPWEPNRRDLFKFTFDVHPDAFGLKGFLQVRYKAGATTPNIVVRPSSATPPVAIVPSWDICDDDIAPWFSGLKGGVPQSPTWCHDGRLRAHRTGADGGALSITVFDISNFTNADKSPCYSCTLVGETMEGGEPKALPQWVPSPVRSPKPVPEPAASLNSQFRLWLFNPHALVIYEWSEVPDDAHPGPETNIITRAKEEATLKLWELGWTREAVLEVQVVGTPKKIWLVIDSPLQNRGASVAWFGWPLGPQDVYPVDDLPHTAQIAQRRSSEPESCSLQVPFEQDAKNAGVSPIWPVLYREGPDATAAGAELVTTPYLPAAITFRSAGMRVGVPHRLVKYADKLEVDVTKPFAPDVKKEVGLLSTLRDDKTVFAQWMKEEISTLDVTLTLFAEGKMQLSLMSGEVFSSVRFFGLPKGASVKVGDAYLAVEDGLSIPLTTVAPPPLPATITNPITVQLPSGDGLPYFYAEIRSGETSNWTPVKIFSPAKARMVGIYRNEELFAFGEETFIFKTAEIPSGAGGVSSWLRVAGTILDISDPKLITAAAAIDMDGIITTYQEAL